MNTSNSIIMKPDISHLETEYLYNLYTEQPKVSTDSRCIEPDSLFFALRGDRFDGNRYALAALRAGASYAVIDDASLLQEASATERSRLVVVSDVLAALQALARHHRRQLQLPVLAVAGSNGKTTTKELIHAVLSRKLRVVATRGNLNNHIGVPLTLLSFTRDTEMGIVEMGASACGEIRSLCAIAEPDYGVLTNVGRAHLEGFGGVEGVRRGKGELYDYLQSSGGVAFVRSDDSVLATMASERNTLRCLYYTSALASDIRTSLEGDYNRFNIAAAVAAGRHFGVDKTAICQAIESYHSDNKRSQRVVTTHNTLIVDCYNANPSSMQASVNNFLQLPLAERSHRVLILGDMLELGTWSQTEHQQVLQLIPADAQTTLLLVGHEFTTAYAVHPRLAMSVHCFSSTDELRDYLNRSPIVDALVLVKASHGIGLDRIEPLL
jgi:UDP-N-acetylmuramoyl-tripeptide--D-alanyl-D-alanine ligase